MMKSVCEPLKGLETLSEGLKSQNCFIELLRYHLPFSMGDIYIDITKTIVGKTSGTLAQTEPKCSSGCYLSPSLIYT